VSVETRSRGFMIHYEVAGTGLPLVLVPGTLSSAAQWELFGYVRALAEEFRVVSVDPLGHGRSEKPHAPDAYHAAGVTADLVAVLDAEGIEQSTVWGYSRGGWIAYRLAATYPERVARIVIGGFASHAHQAELPGQSAWCEHLSRSDWAAFWRLLGIEDRRPLKPIERDNDPLAIAAAVAGSQRPTRYVDLEAVRCPSLHYVGGDDPGAAHLGAFADAAPALGAVRPWLTGSV
jgi:pimeloyl-ACP methyl ester carboxylesterase